MMKIFLALLVAALITVLANQLNLTESATFALSNNINTTAEQVDSSTSHLDQFLAFIEFVESISSQLRAHIAN